MGQLQDFRSMYMMAAVFGATVSYSYLEEHETPATEKPDSVAFSNWTIDKRGNITIIFLPISLIFETYI